MLRKNLDFFAVVFIALTILGFAELRSERWSGHYRAVRIENAINVQECQFSTHVLSAISSLFR